MSPSLNAVEGLLDDYVIAVERVFDDAVVVAAGLLPVSDARVVRLLPLETDRSRPVSSIRAVSLLSCVGSPWLRSRVGDATGSSTRWHDEPAGVVSGAISRVLRDPAMSEAVTQEVFVEMWRTVAEPLDLRLGTGKGRVRLGSSKPRGNPGAAS